MPNPNDMGENFTANILVKVPELAPHKEKIDQWARWATHFLAKIDSEGDKKAKLAQIVYFRAVNEHKYGDPAKNPGLALLLDDLKACFARKLYEAYTQEELAAILAEAFHGVSVP